jgi:acyl-CoA reductase-like NAD-dependent aldehyde dehydrogenase
MSDLLNTGVPWDRAGAELTIDVAMTINGESVKTDRAFAVLNPATGRHLADAPDCSRSQVDQVMDGAMGSFGRWRLDDAERCAALHAAAIELEANAMELALILTAEQGKPLRDSLSEVATSARWLRWYADLDIAYPQLIESSDERKIEVHRLPLGPVVAITPWNYPIQMVGKKAAQALRAGNTVVVKPSPYTPLATLKFVEVLQKVLPPGVLSAVTGGADLGPWLSEHLLTRKISFTGSTGVGKMVAMSAISDLKRVTLELGGNDAAIVLEDADPEIIARGIFDRAFLNCGQTCAAIKRVYVPERLHDQVVEALAARAQEAVVGDGMDPRSEYGPVNNLAQLQLVADLVEDALRSGAKAAAGGKASVGDGYFYRPTILSNVEDGTRIVDEEQFGPALPVVAYRDLDDAVRRANSGVYGLGASVWTSDPIRGREVASRLEAGTVWVNTHAVTTPEQPFAGAKWSGVGVENGRWGLYEFTQLQAIHTAY